MNNNPFGNHTFETVWLKHFNNSVKPIKFKSIKHVKFYKDKYFPLLVNVGRNISNGMHYVLDENETDYKGKTFLIYDVPGYFNIDLEKSKGLKVKRARQFKGASAEFESFETFEDYFKYKYKSNSRYKHKRNISRFEACFNANHKIFCGDISKNEYDIIFKHLESIIGRRFDSLGLDNNILSKSDYYEELIYKMVSKKEAVLIVLYDDNTPIGVSLGFLSNTIMFYAITSFNIDYYRFNLGHITIIKLMQWCFDKGYKTFDFSKGLIDYKDRWTNKIYDYECHILYDSESIKSSLVANITYTFFKFKQYLREKKINKLYNKIKFILKKKTDKIIVKPLKSVDLKDEVIDVGTLIELDKSSKEFDAVKAPLFDFLYRHPEKIDDIKIYKSKEEPAEHYAIGKLTNLKIY